MSFASQTPQETRLLSFDLSGKAASGVTLSTATVTATVLSGPGLVADLTIGTAGIVDLTVTALATGVTDGTRYRLKAVATASNGEILEVDKDLTISASSALIP